jgi:hypothetical protein
VPLGVRPDDAHFIWRRWNGFVLGHDDVIREPCVLGTLAVS